MFGRVAWPLASQLLRGVQRRSNWIVERPQVALANGIGIGRGSWVGSGHLWRRGLQAAEVLFDMCYRRDGSCSNERRVRKATRENRIRWSRAEDIQGLDCSCRGQPHLRFRGEVHGAHVGPDIASSLWRRRRSLGGSAARRAGWTARRAWVTVEESNADRFGLVRKQDSLARGVWVWKSEGVCNEARLGGMRKVWSTLIASMRRSVPRDN
jgi:hypothetical protein